jgi:hypothetical protein
MGTKIIKNWTELALHGDAGKRPNEAVSVNAHAKPYQSIFIASALTTAGSVANVADVSNGVGIRTAACRN